GDAEGTHPLQAGQGELDQLRFTRRPDGLHGVGDATALARDLEVARAAGPLFELAAAIPREDHVGVRIHEARTHEAALCVVHHGLGPDAILGQSGFGTDPGHPVTHKADGALGDALSILEGVDTGGVADDAIEHGRSSSWSRAAASLPENGRGDATPSP